MGRRDIAMPCVFLTPCCALDEKLDVCPAQLTGPSMPEFFLTLTPRAASRPESIAPHISGVDLVAAFKTTLHKKY